MQWSTPKTLDCNVRGAGTGTSGGDAVKGIVKRVVQQTWRTALAFCRRRPAGPRTFQVNFRPTYNEDGLCTNHICDFVADPRFQHAYDLCYATESSQGWHFRWRVHTLLWAASVCRHLEGDFVECGTYLGGSARAIVDYLQFGNTRKTFFLVDTYEGLPEGHKELHHYQQSHYFDRVQASFAAYPNVRLIKGRVPSVLSQVAFGPIAFLHIDMGIPEAEIDALRFFWGKLVKGALVVLNYYAYPVVNTREIRQVYDQFASEVGCELYNCPTGQGLIVKV